MITLKTDSELLIQIHKNQISIPLQAACLIRLTGELSGKSVEVFANVEELTNCYILTITDSISGIGTNALLEIFDEETLAFRAESFIVEPA
jgi:hypothetical protein